jgi:hypothetical protein
LEALGKPAGPEDLRSKWQRQHDALEEACRRLLAAVKGSAGTALVQEHLGSRRAGQVIIPDKSQG